jgi:hypothetical protein
VSGAPGAGGYSGLDIGEGGRLFHIGIPKTGTTFIQRTAVACRAEVEEHGVCYPRPVGTKHNHRDAVHAVLGYGLAGTPAPGREVWDAFRAQVQAETRRRVWFGYEAASGASEDQARFFASQLGPRLHVVITLRGFGDILPSIWQESAKLRSGLGYEDFLRSVIGGPEAGGPEAGGTGRRRSRAFLERNDQGLVVRRWAEVMGPENVTVVIVDKQRPDHLAHAFEGLLGLPHGLLAGRAAGPGRSNRALTLDEAELARRVAAGLRHDLAPADYLRIVRSGAMLGIIHSERDRSGDRRLALPQWAAEAATRRGGQFADQIAASGVRVVGNLGLLRAEARGVPERQLDVPDVPIGIGVDAVAGVALRGAELLETARAATREARSRSVGKASSRQLTRVMAGRVARRAKGVVQRKGKTR